MCKHKSTARVSTFRTNLKFDIWYDALFLVLKASICLGTLSSNFFKYSSGIVFRDSWRCFQKLFFGPEIWTLWRWSYTASVMLRLRLRLWGGQSMPDTAPILLSRCAFTAYRVFWLTVMLNNEAFAIRMFFPDRFVRWMDPWCDSGFMLPQTMTETPPCFTDAHPIIQVHSADPQWNLPAVWLTSNDS